MAVDPCFNALLADRRNELRRPRADICLDDIRRANATFLADTPRPPIHSTTDIVCEALGVRLLLRIYRPSNAVQLPLIVFFHGGGFVLGDLETHDALCRSIARETGYAVAAVDYRRAPENPFPGLAADCYAALWWLVSNAALLDVDSKRIALCGDSAGANLAVAVALRARDERLTVRHLGLLYPMTDATCNTASVHAFANGYLLTREAIQWFWELYLPRPEDAAHPRASVLRANVEGLPPATVLTAEYDPLRDEGEAFARRLRASGVPTVARRYAGMLHGFATMSTVTPVAGQALRDLAAELRACLGGGSRRQSSDGG